MKQWKKKPEFLNYTHSGEFNAFTLTLWSQNDKTDAASVDKAFWKLQMGISSVFDALVLMILERQVEC